MKEVYSKRFFLAVIAVFVVSQATDFLIHGVILKPTYEATKELWRPDMEDKMWIMMITTIIFSFFFVNIYHFFLKGHFKSGLFTGLCFGFLTGMLFIVPGVLNQYVVYNVGLGLTWQWLIFGMIQMLLFGAVTALIYNPEPK